ncbi:MAG: zinc-binding dehydrogenase [Bacteroidota bacterium]|nr:zinc-binding dehydrogenase [Bacteroidota bacterium]
MQSPKEKKAIELPAYNANIIRALRSLKVVQLKIRQPEKDEVLIKVVASPCNPSDIAFIQGGYRIVKSLPAIPGFEGTGIVVESGNHVIAKELLGKRVSFFSQDDMEGAWSEYLTTKASNCIVSRDDLPTEQAACLFINPFTAYALFEIALKNKARTIVINAAAGQIGIFIQKLARNAGITTINIVRKQKHIAYLKTIGERIVIDQTADNFGSALWSLTEEFQPTIALDAIGGEMTGTLMNNMPEGSKTIVYGGLSGLPIGNINPLDLIFDGKQLSGFNLNTWLAKLSRKKLDKVSTQLQEMIINQEIRTRVQGKATLEKIEPALMQYIRNMSDGKVLLTP